MKTIATFGSLLLLSTALVAPAAVAQTATPTAAVVASSSTEGAADTAALDAEAPLDSAADAGGDAEAEIVITGRHIPDAIRATPEVVSVLSAGDIARTGEGDIAGALQRVTGLSVVGGRFVYVRGLGERYSLALLNGSPLPSPEPLRRVIPLDIFPTSMIAGSVVQKSYSANYPGEFGGGVINLTTIGAPEESFLEVGVGLGFDSETTGKLGYTYYGSDTDWTGFDDGTRDLPAGLQAAVDSNKLIVVGPNFSKADIQGFTASLVNAPTTLIQRNRNIPVNTSVSVSGGTSFDLGDTRLGLIASVGYGNSWQTKGGIQQVSGGVSQDTDGSAILRPDQDFRFLSTENRIVVNGLLGLGLEFGEHKLNWTNLYIRDTLKEARIQTGTDDINVGHDLLNIGNTAWFERQLIDTQLVGAFDFEPVTLDVRATYANSQRESPYERSISYRYNDEVQDFINDLRTNGQYARIAFSDLNDNVYAASADLGYAFPASTVKLSGGFAYYKNDRNSTRRDFRYTPLGALPLAVAQQRPDYLLSDFNVYAYDILLTDVSSAAGVAAYEADLEVLAGYAQAEAELVPHLRLTAGVRVEEGRQTVTPIDIFGLGGVDIQPSRIKKTYALPSATLTWNFAEDMQFRLHASKTIARPQFRELAPQQYLDTESDRTFFGNQFLTDSELLNAEARYEFYFGKDQRVSLAGFYKKIDKPIEAVAFEQGGSFFTTFANAPEATLLGAELEVQKYLPLEGFGDGNFWASRRLALIGNYTFTDSKIKVGPNDTTIPVGSGGVPVPASNLFVDGSRMTGQSKHIANIQVGLESTDRLSQQTLMLTYASRRVTNRGPSGQPDLIEEPGLRLDFVAREGITLFGADLELKFEARNLTGENYEEYQTLNTSRIDNNTYDLGRTFSLGLTMKL
ncbi:TonB-dependent receptor plug domain-containing protein [Allosphingosinicella humi]